MTPSWTSPGCVTTICEARHAAYHLRRLSGRPSATSASCGSRPELDVAGAGSPAVWPRSCGSLAPSSRARPASRWGRQVAAVGERAAWSSIVVKIDSVPSLLSATSTSRDCCGKSMWAAVLISQKPPVPSARWCAETSLLWVCPLTQAMTCGVRAARARPGRRAHAVRVAAGADERVVHRVDGVVAGHDHDPVAGAEKRRARRTGSGPATRRPSPLGLTVSRTTKRSGPLSKM